MSNAKTPEGMDLSELIEGFERDIVYDAHGYTARFERSQHRQELQRRGRGALPAIVAHLQVKLPSSFMNLDTAWGNLLNWIEIEIDPEKSGPQTLKDTPAWIAWAERIVSSMTSSSSQE